MSNDNSPGVLKVFIVEDNEDSRLILGQILRANGFGVETAGTLEVALANFARSGSQVLLSDLGLPDGDGWTLLHRLRESGVSPYAIAMSGFGTMADLIASREAGFRHHLVKPIDLDALERLLEDARGELGRTGGAT